MFKKALYLSVFSILLAFAPAKNADARDAISFSGHNYSGSHYGTVNNYYSDSPSKNYNYGGSSNNGDSALSEYREELSHITEQERDRITRARQQRNAQLGELYDFTSSEFKKQLEKRYEAARKVFERKQEQEYARYTQQRQSAAQRLAQQRQQADRARRDSYSRDYKAPYQPVAYKQNGYGAVSNNRGLTQNNKGIAPSIGARGGKQMISPYSTSATRATPKTVGRPTTGVAGARSQYGSQTPSSATLTGGSTNNAYSGSSASPSTSSSNAGGGGRNFNRNVNFKRH